MPMSERLTHRPMRLAALFTVNEWKREKAAYEYDAGALRGAIDIERMAAVNNWHNAMIHFNDWTYDFIKTMNDNREITGLRLVEAGSPELDRMIFFDRWQQYYESFIGQRGVLFVKVQAFAYPSASPTGKQGHLVRGIINQQKKTVAMTLAQHLLNGDDKAPMGIKKQPLKALRRNMSGGTIPAACRLAWFHTTLRTHDYDKEAFAVAVIAYDPFYAQQQMMLQEAMSPERMEEFRAEWQKLLSEPQAMVPLVPKVEVPEPSYFDPTLRKVVPISEYRQD